MAANWGVVAKELWTPRGVKAFLGVITKESWHAYSSGVVAYLGVVTKELRHNLRSGGLPRSSN